jgi:hypothetical protein
MEHQHPLGHVARSPSLSRARGFFSNTDSSARPRSRPHSLASRSHSPSPSASSENFSVSSRQDNWPRFSNGPSPPASCILGVCAMDIKARSKAMREILTRLRERSRGAIDVKVFGDKVILDEGQLRFLLNIHLTFQANATVMQTWRTGHAAMSSFHSSVSTFPFGRQSHTSSYAVHFVSMTCLPSRYSGTDALWARF